MPVIVAAVAISPEQAAADLVLPEKFKAYVMTRVKDNVATIYKQLP